MIKLLYTFVSHDATRSTSVKTNISHGLNQVSFGSHKKIRFKKRKFTAYRSLPTFKRDSSISEMNFDFRSPLFSKIWGWIDEWRKCWFGIFVTSLIHLFENTRKRMFFFRRKATTLSSKTIVNLEAFSFYKTNESLCSSYTRNIYRLTTISERD